MNVWRISLLIAAAVPLFAGALTLQVTSAVDNPEAQKTGAVLVARITACRSPEKTAVTAVAEGLAGGKRQTIPVKVTALSTPGTFAIHRDWPAMGSWSVRLLATNPDYKNYQTALTVSVDGDTVEWASVQHLYGDRALTEPRP